jgi:hypothetical protein
MVFEDHLSKIILFVDLNDSLLPNMTNIEEYGSPGTYAIVQMLETQPASCEIGSSFHLYAF